VLLASELIGHPAGARVLIVNCDDLGLHQGVNTAVVRAVEEGIATSASLMTPAPAAPDAMRLLRARPYLRFGVHLTLVRDTAAQDWVPLSAPERVPSLLDDAGLFRPAARIPELLARARLDEVAREFRAQIEAVAAAGLTPTHLDWHRLTDGGRDDIFDLTVTLAAEYNLAVRAWHEPARRKVRRLGRPAVDHPFLHSFALGLEDKQARYADLLRAVPAGLSEWAVHPGLGDDESRAADPGWRVRRTDLDFLVSPAARAIVRDEGIVLTDYQFAPPA
jgi:predicted glycoside hydrolase/deacetylase ChbG (UPF0249 family)